jgi:hypothetical protein
VRCLGKIGYNSHGVYLSLGEIKELELERGNEEVVSSINAFLEQYPSKKDASSIWIMMDAFQCFKQYYLSLNPFDKSIQEKFPFWETLIHEIDLQDMQLVCEDGCNGYLYCCNLNL